MKWVWIILHVLQAGLGNIGMQGFDVKLVEEAALRYRLEPSVVGAVIFQESSGNIFAHRVEPTFYRKYLEHKKTKELEGHVPPEASLPTEKWGRSTSWGLMQILGETARGLNFKGPFFPALCEPAVNLDLGCKYLATQLEKARTAHPTASEREHYEWALWKYNGSRQYADLIFNHIEHGRHRKFLPRVSWKAIDMR